MAETDRTKPERTAHDTSPDGEPTLRVEDRRHWARADRDDEDDASEPEAARQPTVVDEYRRRAEEAEARLHEYIAAYKTAEAEHEAFRERLLRDVDRRVDLKFGELVHELLDGLDDLDVALGHVEGVAEAEPLARGVTLVRDRFLATLQRNGVEPVRPDGEPFDPNESEAVRVDPVDDPGLDAKVTETLRPGYRLGDRVIRPAKVAVGKRRT